MSSLTAEVEILPVSGSSLRITFAGRKHHISLENIRAEMYVWSIIAYLKMQIHDYLCQLLIKDDDV